MGHRCTVAVAFLVGAGLSARQGMSADDVAVPSRAEPRAIEEIIVTAQKREQAIIDVPLSVQQFTGEALEEHGYEDLREVIQNVPGASVAVSTGPGFETYQIRGVASGTQGDASVGFYLDELAFGVPNVQLAPGSRLFDLQSVEVLRGPQGTLYGQGAMGGTIKIRTADPDLEAWGAKAHASGQLVDDGAPGHSVDAAINVPVLPGILAVRAVGGREHTGGVAENADFPGEDDLDDTTTTQGRLKAALSLGDFRLDLGAWQNRIDANFLRLYGTIEPPRTIDSGNRRSGLETLWNLYTARAGYDLGFARLESATAFIDHNLDVTIGLPLLPGAVADPTIPVIGPLGPPLGDSTFDGDVFYIVDTTNFTEELRLVSQGSGPFDWIVGAFYYDAKLDAVADFRSELPGLGSVTTDVIESESWAGFGEASYDLFGGAVIPLVGLRYFTDDRRLDEVVVDEFGNTTSEQHIPKTYTSLSPRFSVTLRPIEDGTVYVNAAKGFRSGALQSQTSVDAAESVGVTTSLSLPSDSLWSYELGGKWSVLDDTLFLETALYYSDWSDAIIQFVPNGVFPSLIEVGDIKGLGVEAAFTYATPIDGLDVQFSTNFNRTWFSDPDPAAAAALDSIEDGKQIPGVPKRTAAVSGSYERDLGFADLGGVAFVSYTYRSPQIGVVNNVKTQSIDDLRARFGVRRGPIELSVFGENLLDQRGPAQFQGAGLVPIYPRLLGLAFQMHLG